MAAHQGKRGVLRHHALGRERHHLRDQRGASAVPCRAVLIMGLSLSGANYPRLPAMARLL